MNLRELDSFKLSDAIKFHDELNPALFDGDHMEPEVRKQLLVIAQDFLDHLGVSDLEVKDITISGSNAAYTYTPHSDIDLHILVDIDKLTNDDVYRELFTAKKTVYNDTHDIKIHGYDVELYVQDTADPVQSLGEYSVLRDKWIKYPVKRRSNFDEKASKQKFSKLVQLAQRALESDDLDTVQHVLDTIKKYRQAGLDKHGEFGPENLAYKALRSKGIVQQLFNHRDELHANLLSLSEASGYIKLNFLSETPKVIELSKQFENYFKSQDTKWYPHRCSILASYIKDYTKLMENFDARILALKEFQKFVKTLDKRKSINVRSGSKISVLQFLPYTSDNIIEIRGHKTPKTITNVILNPGGDSINYIEFDDGTTFPDKNFINGGRGNDYEGLSTIFLQTKKQAEHAITLALLNKPTDWKLSTVNLKEDISEASGYIPSEKEKNDPRWKTALTVDVHPGTMKKDAKKFGNKISRSGIPPTANPNGKI